jgi:SDR family mycofactocin-dependent oxidoreductase
MGRFDGKVVLITGAARGQGRSHAVRFAEEGADVIAVDLCAQIDSVPYPMATPQDLADTVHAVEALDRRILAVTADVRDHAAMSAAVSKGVAELGRLDFVLANAGIGSIGLEDPDPVGSFRDVIDTNLTGVWNTVRAALPVLVDQGQGGSVVLTSSTAGLKAVGGSTGGGEAYVASKHAVLGLMRSFATTYAPHNIRVNAVLPTGVATPMVLNDVLATILRESPESLNVTPNLLPVELIDSADVTHAIAFLCSDEARYVTGVALPIDGGFLTR